MHPRAQIPKPMVDEPDDPDTGPLLLDGLFSRRSVSPKRLTEPGPGTDEILQIVAAALTAPDHCSLRPWRFLHIPQSARDDLGAVFAAIKARRDPTASHGDIARERHRATISPALIAVIARITSAHQRVPVYEQYVSVGAAIQNMLLCAHGLGYGAKMVSGSKAQEPELAAALGVGPWERLIGFVCIGTPTGPRKPRRRPDVRHHLTVWETPAEPPQARSGEQLLPADE